MSNSTPLESYLSIALGQVKKASNQHQERSPRNMRTISYNILIELIKEQIQNENLHYSARQNR